jgi:DbpA RNA binding domain
MNIIDSAVSIATQNDREKLLTDEVQKILASQDLKSQRHLINAITKELKAPLLDCAAALVFLSQEKPTNFTPNQLVPSEAPLQREKQNIQASPFIQSGIRLVRYRLDLGNHHKVTVEEIKNVMVEESGVDVKNIANVRIQDCYTLIDMPDEMPQEIFHHLKSVEINGQKLEIRRVKPRNKKRGNRRHRHARPVNFPPTTKEANQ